MDNKYENDLDNQLFSAILSENISEIDKIIKKGGNINAIEKFGDNMIMEYLGNKSFNSNINIIELLFKNGINTNYENEGFNCLFNAYLSNRDDIVEYLLKIGTSAQCISSDTCESLLDWIEWNVNFEKDDSRTTKEWIERAENIIKLLKNYGAKHAEECYTNNVEEYLKMFGGNNKGLFTKKGYIDIKDIPNIKEGLINDFLEWKNIEKEFLEKTWNKEEIDIQNLIECNKNGLKIINLIKILLPNNIRIQFNYIIPEDYEKNKTRNIKELVIN